MTYVAHLICIILRHSYVLKRVRIQYDYQQMCFVFAIDASLIHSLKGIFRIKSSFCTSLAMLKRIRTHTDFKTPKIYMENVVRFQLHYTIRG